MGVNYTHFENTLGFRGLLARPSSAMQAQDLAKILRNRSLKGIFSAKSGDLIGQTASLPLLTGCTPYIPEAFLKLFAAPTAEFCRLTNLLEVVAEGERRRAKDEGSRTTHLQVFNTGTCHCGAVSFTATLPKPFPEQEVYTCNCSICKRTGFIGVYILIADVVFHKGFETMTEYRYASKKVAHKFCATCGTNILADVSVLPIPQLTGRYCINVRNFEDVELDTLKVQHVDGKNFNL